MFWIDWSPEVGSIGTAFRGWEAFALPERLWSSDPESRGGRASLAPVFLEPSV